MDGWVWGRLVIVPSVEDGGGWELGWFEGVLFSTEDNRVSSGNFLQNMHPLVKLLG